MKKILLSFFVLFCLLVFPSKLFASSTSVYVSKFNSDVNVEKTGEVDITENITYFFNESRHGMYRKIPISYVLSNGNTQYLDIHLVDVSYKSINSDSIYNTYTTSLDSNYFTIKIGDPNTYIRGTYVYTISYKVNYLIENYSNLDKLYINLLGDSWDDPINNVSATITMPVDIKESYCYTGVKNSTESDCTVTKETSQKIDITSNKVFTSGSFLTAAVTVPSGSIAKLDTEKSNFNNTFKASIQNNENILSSANKYVALIFIIFFVVILISFVGVFIVGWNKRNMDYSGVGKYLPNVIPEYNVPRGWYVIKVAAFLRKGLAGTVITAQIIELCVYGYLKIIKNGKDIVLEKTAKPSTDLPLPLQDFYRGLMQGRDSVNITSTNGMFNGADLDSRIYLDTFNSSLSLSSSGALEDVRKEGVFVESKTSTEDNHSQNKSFIIIFILITVLIACAAYALIKGSSFSIMGLFIVFPVLFLVVFLLIIGRQFKTMKLLDEQYKYSSKGEDMKRYIQGLHMYIKTAEQKRIEFNNDPARYIGVFESLLPYAILFGMEKKWVSLFNIPLLSWYSSSSSGDFDISYISSSISSFAMSNMISSSDSSSDSSSGSSGGSSGGGGGGGGGGSW